MLNFKRMGKCLLCLLLCAALSAPVSALAVKTPVSSALIPAVPAIPVETPQAKGEGHLVTLVRRSNSNGSVVIGCLEDGTRVTVLKTYKEFYRIDCYDMNGYIAKSQVQVTDQGEYVVKCDPESKESKYLPSYSAQDALILKSQIKAVANDYLGVRYRWGGTDAKGFDCSGYTQFVMDKVGLVLNRTAMTQLQDGVIIAKEDLQCGDMVFFSNTSGRGFASHVGIYIGNGQIIHSGASTGVTISDLNSTYYSEHFLCARRVVLADLAFTAGVIYGGILQQGGSSAWRDGETGGMGLIGQ